MKRTGPAISYGFATLALGALMAVAPAGAQTQNPVSPDRDDITRQQLSGLDNFLDAHPELAEQIRKDPSLINNEEFVENHADLQRYLQQHPEVREQFNQDPNAVMHQEQRYDQREDRQRDSDKSRSNNTDVTRRELGNMDGFLDGHPEIAEQLRNDPSLINNQKFVAEHPALNEFLASHPGVREEFKENPNGFMNREQAFDRRQDGVDRDVTHRELLNMDQFMDSHPEIAEQLRKDPSLVENKRFVHDHPALEQFLASHPRLQEEYKENPNGFMQREQGFDRREDKATYRDSDVTHRELTNMDRFMDSHPEIAEQLRKNPSLVDNKQFVQHHPSLQEFLAAHPGVREEYKENPNGFMQREQSFDRSQAYGMGHDRDASRGELSSFHEFLEGHGNIATELSKNPSLANNHEYLEDHTALRDYLSAHPKVHDELSENPKAFLKSSQGFEATKTMPKPMAEPKLK